MGENQQLDTTTIRRAVAADQEQEAKHDNTKHDKDHHVRFGTVQIRTFPVTLGIHPSTKTGPSLEMDWAPMEQFVLSVDDFEQTTNHATTTTATVTTVTEPNRNPDDFFLTSALRTELLQRVGFTQQEIDEAIQEIKAIVRQRRETVANIRSDWREEKKEERRNKWKKRFQAFRRAKSEHDLCCETACSSSFYKKIEAYVDEHRTIKPMFDHIPCTHCAETECIGDGCDTPARVGMFRCDGTTCRKGTNCPFKGHLIGATKAAADTGGTRTNSAIVAPSTRIPQAVA